MGRCHQRHQRHLTARQDLAANRIRGYALPACAGRNNSDRDNQEISALAGRRRLTLATWPEPVERGELRQLSAVEQETDPVDLDLIAATMWQESEAQW